MKKALIIGIDKYVFGRLNGCVQDAQKLAARLSRHEDGQPNFDCIILEAPPHEITRPRLQRAIETLFTDEVDLALLYFSGHGDLNTRGGHLVTQDAVSHDEGVPMQDVICHAGAGKAREVVIMLDCCHSGAIARMPQIPGEYAIMRAGISLLAATRATQKAVEIEGTGLFSSLVCDALDGGAADVLGNVTLASIYSYIDQSLNAWEQRPLFVSHVSRLTPIRRCKQTIESDILRLLPTYFPDPHQEFQLDASYEWTEEPRNEEHERIFKHLQKLRAERLVVPVGTDDMYWAAIQNKSCKLSPLGQFYRSLAQKGRI